MTSPAASIRSRPKTWVLVGVALALAAAHFVWIASTWEGMSYVKDEGYYFSASGDNFGWYKTFVSKALEGKPSEAFERKWIDRHWRNNHEHPPFCKTVQGLNSAIWYDGLGWLNYGDSHRMATVMFQWLLIAFMFLLGAEWLGVGWSAFAVILLYTLPRFFYHSHLSTFDIPVVAMWAAAMYAFRRAMTSVRWSYVTGLLFGVGLATKNNVYFLPLMFAVLYFYSPHGKTFFRALCRLPATLKAAAKWKLALGVLLLVAPLAAGFAPRRVFNAVLFGDLVLVNLLLAFHYLRPKPTIPAFVAPILPSIFTAPLVFFLLWPWLWYDTWSRFDAYLGRHLNPPAWETYYLGKIVVNPPPYDWHYPFVMSWYTIPAAVIFLGLLGMAIVLLRGRFATIFADLRLRALGRPIPAREPLLKRWREDGVVSAEWDQLFLLLNIVVPFLIIANPNTPIYGGAKHYATAQPYIALACAVALRWIATTVLDGMGVAGLSRRALTFGLAVLMFVPGLVGIRHVQPHALSYYNEIMGGTIAAPEVGMQRMFWASATLVTLDYINQNAPPNSRVWFNNTPWDSFAAYKKDGYLRADIGRANTPEEADYAVMSNWRFYADGIYALRRTFGATHAEYNAAIDGCPLAEVFRNTRKVEAADRPPRKKSPARPVIPPLPQIVPVAPEP